MVSLTDQLSVIAHADWSVQPDKRWMACAWRTASGELHASAPVQVADARRLLPMILERAAPQGCLLVGLDFPIGLPDEYARRSGIAHFVDALPHFGTGRWRTFFQPAESANQIGLARPFYPQRPGGAKRDHLADQLGIPFNRLYRQCERATPTRRAACPIFWTLGGQQVGKAAISGWKEVLQPGLSQAQIPLAIWPFSGEMDELTQTRQIVAVETYPAEFYPHLNIRFSPPRKGYRSGKRSQADRAANAPALLDCCRKHRLHLASSLIEGIKDGFGDSPTGEDRFDAAVGLLGMLSALENWSAVNEPQEPCLRSIEGWIFGMPYRQPTASEPERQ